MFSDQELKQLSERVDCRIGEFGDEGIGLTIPSLGMIRLVMEEAERIMNGDYEAEVEPPPAPIAAPLIPRKPRLP